MSVKIRLRRMGAKKKGFYRFVIADSRSPRDGKFIELVGTYDPLERPAKVILKEDRIYDWLGKGAIPTPTVYSLFRQVGLIKKWKMMKKKEGTSGMELGTTIQERTKKRKKKKAETVSQEKKESKPPKSEDKEEQAAPAKQKESESAEAEVKEEEKEQEEKEKKE